MIKLINIILLLLAFITSMAEPSDSIKKANELYVENEFAKAIAVYENLLNDGFESAALYYNLGNAYYKNGEVTRAILNYERAKLISPNDEDIKHNLELSNLLVVDKIEPLPKPFYLEWRESVINLFSTDKWAKISLSAFVLMLICVLAYFFSSILSIRKTAFGLAIVLLIFSAFTYSFASKQKAKLVNRTHAIIFSPTVTVKASPDDSGTNLFVIHEGLKVSITNQLNNWTEIRLEDGNSGWVKNNVLEKI